MSRLARLKNRHWILAFVGLAFLSTGFYVLVCRRYYGLGFPLDDAWIHQTYAHNLVQRGQWAFIPDVPSAGSTAPLWTALVAIGHWIGLSPILWNYLLGTALLALIAWACGRWIHCRLAHRYRWTWILGLGILWEWHLVWAALSGMETLLFALLTVFVLWAIDGKSKRGEILGFLVGLGVWIRPDAISLLLPVGWSTLMEPRSSITARMKRLIKVAIGFSVVVIPYLGFNRSLSGAWLPMTFYAKQREYAILLQQPLWERFAAQISVPMVGVGIALAPGMILGVYQIIRDRHWTHAGVWLWVLTYAGLYACRLPTTYQHGRYAMPIVPVVWGLGLEGLICGVRIQDTCMVSRLISKAWVGTAAILTLAFYLLGAQAFAQDVAIIETEMVASAQWIAAHTEPQALVAAHDIGALGYWGQRQLLDLAGLVSPEVIPFLRDEEALSLYLDQQNADYLMTFPGWYPTLATEGDLVFSTNAPYSLEAGGENMAVYEWKASDGNP